jgi:hypothetical protein
MLTWCAVLFALGLLAFLDSLLNMGEIFRRVNSVMFMLVSLGLLIRTTTKMRSKQVEETERRVMALEQEVKMLKDGRKKLGID